MVKVSVYIGTSLDGFIARENGDIGWLDEANKNVTPGEDFGFNNFIESVDLIVMGRKTFEQVKVFDNWPYMDKRLIVLTTKTFKSPKSWRDLQLLLVHLFLKN